MLSLTVPFLLLFAAYYRFHSTIGLPNGEFRNGSIRSSDRVQYSVQHRANAFRDAATTFHRLDAVSAIAHRAVGMETAAAISAILVAAVALTDGFGRLRKFWILILAGAIGSISPVIFLNHVGKLYLYSLLPFVAITFGIGCEFFMRSKRGAKLIAGFLILGVATNLWSVALNRIYDAGGRQPAPNVVIPTTKHCSSASHQIAPISCESRPVWR